MAPLSKLLSLALLTSFSLAAPLTKRASIPSNEVVSFPQTAPSGTLGTLYLKYKPYLDVVNGCVPFPAVDAQGNTNAGLQPTGSPSGSCSSSTGQVYSRAGTHNGAFGIMYAWYWPKDEPDAVISTGHRHDWESMVVWLSAESTSATISGAAASAHGDFATSTTPSVKASGSAEGVLVEYVSNWPLDHQLEFTSTVGGQQPLIAYESLPTVAHQALANTDWGAANVPFIDANFQNNLAEAAL